MQRLIPGVEAGKVSLEDIMDILNCDANYLFQDALDMPVMKNSVSVDEYIIIEKYRLLDSHGKEMVDFTLEKEYERSKTRCK